MAHQEVRTLVFRGWAGPTALDLLTDGRSAKPAELFRQPAVELCWLLSRARSQFRLRGSLQSLPPEQVQGERERHWLMLSPGGRAVWGWPPPGEPFDPEAVFPEQLPDGSPPPVLEGEHGVGGGVPQPVSKTTDATSSVTTHSTTSTSSKPQ
jgi:pyridoxamine 5'-phosphate oxidase